MNKRSLILVVTILLVGAFVAGACGQAAQPAIVIGVNAPLTGDIPKVGEGSKFAAEMWLEDINAAGGFISESIINNNNAIDKARHTSYDFAYKPLLVVCGHNDCDFFSFISHF